jgi:hypothetical protein
MASQRKFILGAIPTILFIVGGSFALANVRRGRYEVIQEKDRQLAKAETSRKKFDIDEEYEARVWSGRNANHLYRCFLYM